MRDRKMQQRITVVLGFILVFAMAASLALPLLANMTAQPQVIQPTNTPAPTVPAPIGDLNSIDFSQTYLHPSGLFTSAVPSGWTTSNELKNTGEAQVTMRNPNQLSVIEVRASRPTAEQDISTLEGVSAIFDNAWLTSSWREYSAWDEANRTLEDDRVVIDFNLSRSGQDYIARQESYTDGTLVYSVRVVTPDNASQMLRYVLDNMVDNLQTVDQYIGTPIEWNAYVDETGNVTLRYLGNWALVDDAPDAPASIVGNNAQLRIDDLPGTIDNEDAASAFVQGTRTNIEVLSVEAVEQFGSSGYNVAYTFTTVDGDTQSGLVTILNGEDSAHAANLLLTDVSDTDLNAVDTAAEDTPQIVADGLDLLATFSVNTGLNLTTDDVTEAIEEASE